MLTQDQMRNMGLWTGFLAFLLASLFAILIVALFEEPREPRLHPEGDTVVVVNVDDPSNVATPWPDPPQDPPPSVVLDLNVNAVGGSPAQPALAPSASGAGNPVQTVVNVSGSPGSPTVKNRQDLTVLVENAESPAEQEPLCSKRGETPDGPLPCATAELLGRIRFDAGSRRITAWHRSDVETVAMELGSRTGALLVVGHADRCGNFRLAERRARKVRRNLRRHLKSRPDWPTGQTRVHAQASGEDPGAPENTCEERHYGTAGVYLIKGLE